MADPTMRAGGLETSDLKVITLCLALGLRLTSRSFTPTGQVMLTFADVPPTLMLDLANERLPIQARRWIEAQETAHSIIGQMRRERGAWRA